MHPNTVRADSGYSLVELVVVSALIGMLVYGVTSLAVSGAEAQEYARRLNRATEVTQDMIDQVRTEMASSVRIFGNDAEGIANLAVLDLSSAPTPLTGLRLPTISASESIRPDTSGAEITGNSLFFARIGWCDHYECASGNRYMVDVYRWTYYYLAMVDDGIDPEHPIGLDLVRVDSEPLVDGASIDRILDPTDQAEVLLHLLNATPDLDGQRHEPCEVVWMRGDLPSVAGTLRQIDSSDGSLSVTPIAPRTNPWAVQLADTDVQGLLAYRHHSIASNYAMPSFGVGKYSVMTTTGDGFPHGFEVQIVGPSGGRQTLLHAVVSSTFGRGQWAWCDVQVVIDSREL
jgi:type II secretory pathway pseudopilin PulG